MDRHIENLEALASEAKALVERTSPKDDAATLVTLAGELGAGKTAFTQALARVLGVEDTVTSPTFVLEKIYALMGETNSAGFAHLIHIDAYRLESGAQLAALDFDELMQESKNLIVLEWPERVADALPSADISITLVPNPDGSRTFSYAE